MNDKLKRPITLDKLSVDYMAILSTQSKTFETDGMAYMILKELNSIPGVSWEYDGYGNIYATKGKVAAYPAFVCHIDTVHLIKETYKVVTADDYWFAVSHDNDELQQVGIGGDDKCGIIACLEFLHRMKAVKCAFFLDEEQGCKGSSAGRLDFFDDCRFAIQVDRKNNGDIITSGNGTELCSDEFKEHVAQVGATYNYKPTFGASTDVVTLKNRGLEISAINLSAGYHNPHGKNEYIKISAFLNCLQFCLAMASFTQVFKHKPEPKKFQSYSSQYNGNYQNGNANRGQGKLLYSSSKPGPPLDKKCPECDKPLATTDSGGIHESCLDKLYADHEASFQTLKVRDDGEVTLEISDKEELSLPSEMTEKLPSDDCLLCGVPMVYPTDKARGYCGGCEYCECGNRHTTTEELIRMTCEMCLAKLSGKSIPDNEKPVNMCASSGCTNSLIHDIEKMEQQCDECRNDMMLMR